MICLKMTISIKEKISGNSLNDYGVRCGRGPDDQDEDDHHPLGQEMDFIVFRWFSNKTKLTFNFEVNLEYFPSISVSSAV